MIEQGQLRGGQFPYVVGCRTPAGVRVALPGTDAAARGVKEDAVEFGFGRKSSGPIPERGAVIEKFRAGRPAFERVEPLVVAIRGPDEALVHHQVGEMKRLAAFAGAGVPPGFPRQRSGSAADELRTKVLNFEFTGFELFGFEKILCAGETESVGNGERRAADFRVLSFGFRVFGWRRSCARSLPGTRNFGLGAAARLAREERFSEARGLSRSGANPKRRIALELAQVISSQSHLARQPGGHGEGSQGLGLDGFGVGGETLVEDEGVIEPLLRRSFGIEPGKPAEINEDGVTDRAACQRLEVAMRFEIKTQGGVGALVD